MSRRWRAAAVLAATLIAGLGTVLPVKAAEAFSADAVKAAFLYRFAGYVEWPQSAAPDREITIAVMGSDKVAAELRKLLPERPAPNQPTQIRTIGNIRQLGGARILYIGTDFRGDLGSVIASIGAQPVLVVTDHDGGLDEGGAVNFLLVDRRLRFEVSLAAAERAGLKISSELLSVAVRVQGGRARWDPSHILSRMVAWVATFNGPLPRGATRGGLP